MLFVPPVRLAVALPDVIRVLANLLLAIRRRARFVEPRGRFAGRRERDRGLTAWRIPCVGLRRNLAARRLYFFPFAGRSTHVATRCCGLSTRCIRLIRRCRDFCRNCFLSSFNSHVDRNVAHLCSFRTRFASELGVERAQRRARRPIGVVSSTRSDAACGVFVFSKGF